MSAIFSPAGLRGSRGAWMDGLLPALALLTLVLLPTCARAEAQDPVVAVWKERQLRFSYLGFMAVYPCHVLQNRIARVLNAVGARPDLQVTLTHCDASFASPTVVAGDDAGGPHNPSGSLPGAWPTGPSRDGAGRLLNTSESGPGAYRRTEPRQVVDVQVQLSMPAAMTQEVIAELKADRKRRELIARVTGDPLPLFADPIAFAAQRKAVTLSHETTGIEAADCELLDQMASSVFRTLGVRIVRRGYTCDRTWVSRIRPTLDVEALVPVVLQVTDARETPAPGDDQPDPPVPEDSGEAPATTAADRKPE